MSIPWLAGIPVRSRALVWPSNDGTILAGIWDREGTSVLDGLILHWFALTRNTKRTVVYLADTRPQGEEPVVLSSVEKELEFAADRIALVGSNEFSSAEWVESDETLKLRLHSLDGSLVRESSISVKAAYGDLRVFGQKVFIAISSGPTNAPEGSMTPGQLRLGSHPNDMDTSSPLFADQILEWDTTSCVFRRIKIPDPLYHGAEYTFPVEHQVALAGLVEDGDGREQLALTCFNADDQVQNQSVSRSFSPGGSSQERAIQEMSVGLEGNTKSSDVIVHSFDRIAVFNRTFFSEEMPINPRTGHLHYLRPLLLNHDVSILPFSLPGTLPAISNNRVLAYQKIAGKYLFHILDFDQNRVNTLLNETPDERHAFRAELSQAGSNARTKVKVVTRQSYAQEEGVGGGTIDAEYPIRGVPPEWREHLKSLTQQEKHEQEGASLIFDEAPEGRRSGRFGFVQSELDLGRPISWSQVGRMGITNGCVVLAPEPGNSGLIWYFE